MPTEIFGTLGAFFFAICALPQAIRVFRTGETEAISLLFLIFWALGEVFMWAYVVLDNLQFGTFQWPLHINYGFNAILLTYLLYKKLSHLKSAFNRD